MLGNFAQAAVSADDSGSGSWQQKRVRRSQKSWYSNIYIVTLLLYGVWIVSGLLFYYFVDDWTWATAFFFALQGGLSIGFCAPVEHTDRSRIFTIFYILLGSSVVAGSLGKFAAELVYFKAPITGRKTYRTLHEYLGYDTPTPNIFERCGFLWHRVKKAVGWYTNRPRVVLTLALLVWIIVGVMYGLYMENWSFVLSLYFAVSCLSTAGLQTPTCDGSSIESCTLTPNRGVFLGFFILVGVPLYAVTLGQFAGIAVEHAAEQKRKERMEQPIESRDFHYAATLLSEEQSTTLELGEFIILELMRLGIADRKQIKQICNRFKELDIKKNSVLDYEELRLGGYVIEGKIHRRFTQPIRFDRRSDTQEGSSGKLMPVIRSASNLLLLLNSGRHEDKPPVTSSVIPAQRVKSDGDIQTDVEARKRGLSLIKVNMNKDDTNTVNLADVAAPVSPGPRQAACAIKIPGMYPEKFAPGLSPVFSATSEDPKQWSPRSLYSNVDTLHTKGSSPTKIARRKTVEEPSSIVTRTGIEIPILPPKFRPKTPKAYDPSNDDDDSDVSVASDHSGDNDSEEDSASRRIDFQEEAKNVSKQRSWRRLFTPASGNATRTRSSTAYATMSYPSSRLPGSPSSKSKKRNTNEKSTAFFDSETRRRRFSK